MARAGTGQVFQLDPSFFGIHGLGDALREFGGQLQQRREREKQEEQQEFLNNQTIFGNLLQINPDAATRFHNTVIQPGGTAERRLTSDEFLDQEILGALQARSLGEPLSTFHQDIINQRVFGTLTPDLQKQVAENEVLSGRLLNDYQELINQGVPEEQRAIQIQNRAGELANQATSRQLAIDKALDEAARRLDPRIGEEGAAGFQLLSSLNQLEQEAFQLDTLNPLQAAQLRQDIALSKAQKLRLEQELISDPVLAALPPEFRSALATQASVIFQTAPEGITPSEILQKLVDPEFELSEEAQSAFSEGKRLARAGALAEAERIAQQVDQAKWEEFEALSRAGIFENSPELAYTMVVNLLDGVVEVEEINKWIGPDEFRLNVVDDPAAQTNTIPALLKLARRFDSEDPLSDDELSVAFDQILSTQFGGDSAAMLANIRDSGSPENEDVRALQEYALAQLEAQLGSGATGDEDVIPDQETLIGPELGTIVDEAPEAFNQRLAGLQPRSQLQARQTRSRVKNLQAEITRLERLIEADGVSAAANPLGRRRNVSALEHTLQNRQNELTNAMRRLAELLLPQRRSN